MSTPRITTTKCWAARFVTSDRLEVILCAQSREALCTLSIRLLKLEVDPDRVEYVIIQKAPRSRKR